MSRRIVKLVLLGLLVAGVGGVISWRAVRATDPDGLTYTPIVGPVAFDEIDTRSHSHDWRVRITTRGLSDVYVTHIRIVPGGHSGWHSHPGPSIVTVISGTATFYHGDDDSHTPNVFPAGTGFVEEAARVHINRNEGDTDLQVIVMQIVPRGAPRRIDEPQPPGYPF